MWEEPTAVVCRALVEVDFRACLTPMGHPHRSGRGSPGEGEQDVSLDLHRDGDDLVIEVQGRMPRGTRLLAARQRDQSRLDWFDRYELAVVDDTLVLPRARALTRLEDFFGSSRNAARAVRTPTVADASNDPTVGPTGNGLPEDPSAELPSTEVLPSGGAHR